MWIWPDDSPTAFIDSSMVKPNGPAFDSRRTKVYMRDLPYPIDGLIENVVDPSHVPYAHHGYQVGSFFCRVYFSIFNWCCSVLVVVSYK